MNSTFEEMGGTYRRVGDYYQPNIAVTHPAWLFCIAGKEPPCQEHLTSKERLMELASARNEETCKVAYKQAQKDFEKAQKQATALEEEAVKALTGESQLDLSVVNAMLVKHRAKLQASQTAMQEAQTRMQAEKENARETKAQIDELLSWAECFEKADIGAKHLIVARLVERVDVSTGYKMHIKFKISLKQFLGQE